MQFDPKPRRGGVASFAAVLLILSADLAVGRPDVRESPFARELQPPLLQPDVTFSPADQQGAGPKAIDSYGNPIDALRPIDTPDGRKVVSAQGVQFEIPTYASGITEIRRPADDLLPPHIARFEPPASSSSSSSSAAEPFPPSKVEYTKSDEGKVISTPVTSNQRRTEAAAPAVNTGKYTGGFGAPAGLLRPQTTSASGPNPSASASSIYVAGNQHEFSSIVKANKARPTVNPGRYNGGFGAPTGVLSPQAQAQAHAPAEPRPFQAAVHQQAEHREPQSGTASRFGGPPGILVPFDNVQRTGGQ
ncbi:transmembrane protein 108 isoform X4 [Drosophila biarmipes]|uniref:transmembrane protein 108 isoform X4 n=1 Tax=Drosophila biarmipes TaxID=125945 RepID=UPI0007E5C49A|nr:transmembrane protein 108 isoform X4 [Drosophila biarmipes]